MQNVDVKYKLRIIMLNVNYLVNIQTLSGFETRRFDLLY